MLFGHMHNQPGIPRSIQTRQRRQAVLEGRQQGQMAGDLVWQRHYGQRQVAERLQRAFGGGTARGAIGLSSVQPLQRCILQGCSQATPDALLQQAQHPHGDGQQAGFSSITWSHGDWIQRQRHPFQPPDSGARPDLEGSGAPANLCFDTDRHMPGRKAWLRTMLMGI